MRPEPGKVLSELDTEIMLNQLHNAQRFHIEWLARLHEYLVCGSGDDPEFVADNQAHRHCEFGEWLYNDVDEKIRSREDFQQMEQVHFEMHEIARQLLAQYHSGKPIPIGTYRDFITCQHRLIDAIEKIRDDLNVVRMSYDNLTGTLRRDAFMLVFEKQFRFNQRNTTNDCLAMIDLDHFKHINDAYGHLVGDKVLQATARIIINGLRGQDSICRYGGEEFLVLLTDTTLAEALDVLERLREEVSQQEIRTADNESVSVTFSAGVVLINSALDLIRNIDDADTKLYQAKDAGRNRICS